MSSFMRIQSIISPPDSGSPIDNNQAAASSPETCIGVDPSSRASLLPLAATAVATIRHQAPTTSRSEGAHAAAREPDNGTDMASVTHISVTSRRKASKKQPMRSSVACLRCRKSKIKCDNDGKVTSPCATCLRMSKDCQYSGIGVLQPLNWHAVPAVAKREADADLDDSRKKLKRCDDWSSPGDSSTSRARHAREVLEAHYLTETMWNQVFTIFRLHFAAELPFLHLPTLKETMAASGPHNHRADKDTPADTKLVLLGILTLTARFHDGLIKHVTHGLAGNGNENENVRNADSHAASECFRDALVKSLGPLEETMVEASVECVQALLMLGLFEWTQTQPRTGALGAWMYVGAAIRMAQALELGFADISGERGSMPQQGNQHHDEGTKLWHESLIVSKEVNRRTMFSCFILDRILSCGQGRVSTIRPEDLHVQLPCSEIQFDLSDELQTGFLRPLPGENATHSHSSDSMLAKFIRLVDLWGDISRFIFAAERRAEFLPPRDETTFRRLQADLDEFYSNLPPALAFSARNFRRHEDHQDSSVYTSLHMLGCVCRIMLNRECIPFIQILGTSPAMALAKPTPPDYSHNPSWEWEESAERVYIAGRELVEIVEICQAGDRLPVSALALFAVWTAACVGIYSWHFPQTDSRRHMLGTDYRPGRSSADVTKTWPTSVAYGALTKMSAWLKMASHYVQCFHELNGFLDRVKDDHHHAKVHRVGIDNGQQAFPGDEKLGIWSGGAGGCYQGWKHFREKIVNNGLILGIGRGGRDGFRKGVLDLIPGERIERIVVEGRLKARVRFSRGPRLADGDGIISNFCWDDRVPVGLSVPEVVGFAIGVAEWTERGGKVSRSYGVVLVSERHYGRDERDMGYVPGSGC